jgi:hypothetical protein
MQSGYAVAMTVNKALPIGIFNSKLKIRTTLKKGATIDIDLTALQLH